MNERKEYCTAFDAHREMDNPLPFMKTGGPCVYALLCLRTSSGATSEVYT